MSNTVIMYGIMRLRERNRQLANGIGQREQLINRYYNDILSLQKIFNDLTEKFKSQRAAYSAAKSVISDFEEFHPYSLFLNATSRKFPNGVPETVKTGVMAKYLRKNLETEGVKDVDKWMNVFFDSLK